jgi:F-type H+-transporting ATPase subunit epsilon
MLKVTLVTPEKKLFTEREVKQVFVPGYEGELNILEGHAAFMTTLETGAFRIEDAEGKSESFSLSWGYCEVNNDHINILAETAENAAKIDVERAQEAYEKAQQKLEEAGLSVSDIEKYQRKLQRADLRITLAQNFRENN